MIFHKTLAVVERWLILAFGDYARLVAVAACREVAVVERFKHEAIMYGL